MQLKQQMEYKKRNIAIQQDHRCLSKNKGVQCQQHDGWNWYPLHCLSKKNKGFDLITVIQKYSSQQLLEYYDLSGTTIFWIRGKREFIKDIIKWTQHNMQLWNDISKITGGTLNVLKCFFQVIVTTFSESRAPVIAAHDKSGYIDIVDHTDNSAQRVEALSAYIPYKSLGTIQEICKKTRWSN